MEEFTQKGGTLRVSRSGNADALRLLLLHGWGQPAASLLPLTTTLARQFQIVGLDTPGNGIAPIPPASWGIDDYVGLVAAWLATQTSIPTVIVCHSFGCRLAMHLAARGAVPGLRGIMVVGGHGLRPIRPLPRRLKVWALVRVTKLLGALDRALHTGLKARWAARIGSPDYQNAGALRPVFVRIVSDDVAPVLNRVTVPVLLLYGANDDQTPPAMGRRFQALLPHSTFHELPGLDHYTVLTSGAGLVQTALREFLKDLNL